jgi:hypothetical protein
MEKKMIDAIKVSISNEEGFIKYEEFFEEASDNSKQFENFFDFVKKCDGEFDINITHFERK